MERETTITVKSHDNDVDTLHIVAPSGVTIKTESGLTLGGGEFDYALPRGKHLIISERGRVAKVSVNDWGLIDFAPVNPIISEEAECIRVEVIAQDADSATLRLPDGVLAYLNGREHTDTVQVPIGEQFCISANGIDYFAWVEREHWLGVSFIVLTIGPSYESVL